MDKAEFNIRYRKMHRTICAKIPGPGFWGWLIRHNKPLWTDIGLVDAKTVDAVNSGDYGLASEHAKTYSKLWSQALSEFKKNYQ